jgi:DNA-binding transcriptional LysR family regulator
VRLERFVVLVEQPSLTQAARTLEMAHCVLTQPLKHIERSCGGLLLHRRGCPHPVGPLTPLGEQLHQQAREHLNLAPHV